MRDQQSIEQAVNALRDAGRKIDIGDTQAALWALHDAFICTVEYIVPGITDSEPGELPRHDLAVRLQEAMAILQEGCDQDSGEWLRAMGKIEHVEQALRWGRPRAPTIVRPFSQRAKARAEVLETTPNWIDDQTKSERPDKARWCTEEPEGGKDLLEIHGGHGADTDKLADLLAEALVPLATLREGHPDKHSLFWGRVQETIQHVEEALRFGKTRLPASWFESTTTESPGPSGE